MYCEIGQGSGHWGQTRVSLLDYAYVSASHLWIAPNFQCEFQNDRKRKPAFESVQVHRDMDQIIEAFCCEY
jgi:hypothetical protein